MEPKKELHRWPGLPLAQRGRERIAVEALNDIANPTRCHQTSPFVTPNGVIRCSTSPQLLVHAHIAQGGNGCSGRLCVTARASSTSSLILRASRASTPTLHLSHYPINQQPELKLCVARCSHVIAELFLHFFVVVVCLRSAKGVTNNNF